MKHLILDNQNIVLAVGSNYVKQADCVPNRYVHNVDGLLFDQSFTHITVSDAVATNAVIGLTKYENGEVVPYKSAQDALRQEGYDNAVNELIEEGVL